MRRGLAGVVATGRSRPAARDPQAMLAALGRGAVRRVAGSGPAIIAQAGGSEVAPPGGAWRPPTGWLVAADARLDDRARLARDLDCPDLDEAVILAAYRRWGDRCLSRLGGEFAFALWDPTDGRLRLGRDLFGSRALMYAEGPAGLAFASEAKGLLALPWVPRVSPELRIAEFLHGRMPGPEDTMFEAIRRVPAGGWLIYGPEGARLARGDDWTLPPPAQARDLPEQLAAQFDAAVRRRTPAGEPVAVTLSGGLDSSSIAVTAARFADQPLPTLSLVFDAFPEVSERPFIEAVVRTGPFDPLYVDPGLQDPFADFQALLRIQDGLCLAPTMAMTDRLFDAMPRGCILLDGHGGDEVISHGYERLHDLARTGRWGALWREGRGAARVTGTSPLAVWLGYYKLYGPGGRRLQRLEDQWPRRDGRPATAGLAPGLATRTQARLAAGRRRAPADLTGRERHLWTLSDPAQAYALEALDRRAAHREVDLRCPFWDRDLVRFMLSIEPDQKLADGWTRAIMRRAMQDRLPDTVRWRRDKHDFAHHLTRGLRASPAASAARFAADADRLSQYLDLAAVDQARRTVLTAPGAAPGAALQTLWRATAVAEWLDFAETHAIRISS
ncbi:asparagine synthase-related protein [Brevundimonas sp.]|uniref:asparagine synthase-related protein n=1 Tax=Brevundimonas sp. TaxID=1871086 RepID=UPI0035AE3C7A